MMPTNRREAWHSSLLPHRLLPLPRPPDHKDVPMTHCAILVPSNDHPITIRACASQVVVGRGWLRVAETRAALTLAEASYPVVQYIPRRDVDMTLLERSDLTTYCPYKGDANYYSIPALGEVGVNCVWTYEAPFEAVGEIAKYLAFYPDRVAIELVD